MTKSQSVSPGRKFDQVVRGAAAIFLRDGFAGASVDDIARAARVSKATLYSYFPDKSHMFQEAMRTETMRLDGSFALDIPADLDPGQAIPVIMAQIAEWLADPAHAGCAGSIWPRRRALPACPPAFTPRWPGSCKAPSGRIWTAGSPLDSCVWMTRTLLPGR